MPCWPSCLDRGALINVDAPGFGTSVVRGLTGHKQEGLHPGFLADSAYISHPATSYFQRPSSYITSESALHQRGPLGRIVPSTDKADKAHSFIKNRPSANTHKKNV